MTTIWLTGLSSAGKTTLAHSIREFLVKQGRSVLVLDGDRVRNIFWPELGFSKEDRDKNVDRLSYLALMLNHNGVDVIVAAISPYRAARDEARETLRIMGHQFVEVFVDCPLETCIQRDVKGLYKKAIDGGLDLFTGISDPYEPPLQPEVHVRTDLYSIEWCRDQILEHVLAHKL